MSVGGVLSSIIVAELPQLRPPASASGTSAIIEPRFVLVLPHSDPTRLPRNVLPFCFPDVRELLAHPFDEDYVPMEHIFALSPRDEPRVYGFCRRYRVASGATGGRLDMGNVPHEPSSSDQTPSYQCICILSERCVASVCRTGADVVTVIQCALAIHTPMHPCTRSCPHHPAGHTRASSLSACSCYTPPAWQAEASR